jgi:hypothetical protein
MDQLVSTVAQQASFTLGIPITADSTWASVGHDTRKQGPVMKTEGIINLVFRVTVGQRKGSLGMQYQTSLVYDQKPIWFRVISTHHSDGSKQARDEETKIHNQIYLALLEALENNITKNGESIHA